MPSLRRIQRVAVASQDLFVLPHLPTSARWPWVIITLALVSTAGWCLFLGLMIYLGFEFVSGR
jgi:hypothetical protein